MAKNGFFVEMETQTKDVTGSCTLVTVRFPDGNIQRIIIDCGSFMERENRYKNEFFNFDPKDLDACIVTHGHIDHIGRLPLLIKCGYLKDIYVTNETANIIPLALEDNFRIECRNYQKAKNNGSSGFKPYQEIHVKGVTKRLKKVNFNSKLLLTPNIEAIFLKNGHIFGAAMIYLRIFFQEYKDINILFSGDYKDWNKFFKVPSTLPFNLGNRDINVISESTYGNSEKRDSSSVSFLEGVASAIEKKDMVLIPAFSLGRTQDVLEEIKKLQNQGIIPRSYRIYHDGPLARKYNDLASKGGLGITRNKYFYPRYLEIVGQGNLIKAGEARRSILESDVPAIIVASSGNGSYGPCNEYLKSLIRREDATILFTGYCTEGTLGRKLLDANGEKVEIDGRLLSIESRILRTAEFSAHADSGGLLDFISKFKNLKSVTLTHGSDDAKKSLKDLLQDELNLDSRKTTILEPDSVTRVNAWGLC